MVKDIRITPYIHEDVQSFLEDSQAIIAAKNFHPGPVHVQFPHIMDENINQFVSTLDQSDVDHRIYFAHKPTKVQAFVHHAKASKKVGIEVASYNEFTSALRSGFVGKDILVTGVKDTRLLTLAAQHQALVSIDSFSELNRYYEIAQGKEKLPILLRIGEPKSVDRVVRARPSRFGFTEKELHEAFEFLSKNALCILQGFHLHYYEANTSTFSSYVDYLISLVDEAHNYGLSPHIIDIGGGWRKQQLAEYKEWAAFIENIEVGLLKKEDTHTWRNHAYGMSVNQRGGISGREKLQAKFQNSFYPQKLNEILDATSPRVEQRTVRQMLQDYMLTLVVEPGIAFLDQCGVSLVRILDVKRTANNETLLVVDASMFQFSHGAFELFTDPMLVKDSEKKSNSELFGAYIVGSTCKEEDFLLTRKIVFPQAPEVGDVLAFINTAHYVSSFVDATPHQHTKSLHIIAKKEDHGYTLVSDEAYSI